MLMSIGNRFDRCLLPFCCQLEKSTSGAAHKADTAGNIVVLFFSNRLVICLAAADVFVP
jgi:hypothetical protein